MRAPLAFGPYEIAVGAPARVVRRCFTEEVAHRILDARWWERDRATLEARWPELCNLEAFS